MSTMLPTTQTLVDPSAHDETTWTKVDPDIARRILERRNRTGHVCRDCREPACVGDVREEHEQAFARAESSFLLTHKDFYRCPRCKGDVRYAPSCRTDQSTPVTVFPAHDGFAPGRAVAA